MVLGPKIAGCVPWATENWTQKDRGENGILGPKRSNFVRICTQKIVFVLVDEKRSSLVPGWSKKGVKTAAHTYHPSYREYPSPNPHPHPTHPGPPVGNWLGPPITSHNHWQFDCLFNSFMHTAKKTSKLCIQ